MTTIVDGHLRPPMSVMTLDIVGYKGNGEFVILNPLRHRSRDLLDLPGGLNSIPPVFVAKIENNQLINFEGDTATLHDVDGVWYFKMRRPGSALQVLQPHTFFEIGDAG